MRKLIRAVFIFCGAQGLFACSGEQVYNSLQGARENECQQIVDATQRNQCLENAHKSYDKYDRQRNESHTL